MTDNEMLQLILDKVTSLDDKVANFDDKVANLDNKVTSLDNKVTSLDNKVTSLKSDLKEVKQDVAGIKLTLENEIRINIQRVAEGHLDLSRNLHKAMKPSNELEMLSIRVSMLESDMRNLKEKIS